MLMAMQDCGLGEILPFPKIMCDSIELFIYGTKFSAMLIG